jgi:hypothetical protein
MIANGALDGMPDQFVLDDATKATWTGMSLAAALFVRTGDPAGLMESVEAYTRRCGIVGRP